jgi:hypothetical protein
MLQLVLTDEQAKLVASAFKRIEVCDAAGHVLGFIDPVWTEEDLAEAKKDWETNNVWYTTEQVLAHLRSLEKK